ncbi:MAG: type VI secretion system protein TssA [Gemmataceae bacterium]|nr:type VI secretion system protein TssA [Planctomycetia bacterium]MBX3397680.1 type VI secretion system protein TssA [Gemmataceae bacterium]
MSTPTVFDPEPLLAPISDDEPAGKRPSILDRNKLKEYREDFDPERDLSEEDRRNPAMAEKPKITPQWEKVIGFAKEYFSKTGKDLTVAMPLIEALTKRHGFAGLRDGLRFTRRLCEECWDRMHPLIESPDDPDEMEGRVAPFVFIDDEINQPRFPNTVRSIPLLDTAEGVAVSFASCQSYDSNPAQVPQEAFRAAVSAASDAQIEVIREVEADIGESLDELRLLGETLDAKAGTNSPGFNGLKKAIDDCRSMALEVLRLRGGGAPPTDEEAATDGSDGTPARSGGHTGGGSGTALGAIRSRDDVYARLYELTQMLEQFDPHSPVPFLIRRAIEMRDLRFPELVDTLTLSRPVLDFLRAPIIGEAPPAGAE